MISSGIAKAEILSLIIANFYKKATDEYYSGGTIEEILNELENKKKCC